MIDLFQDKRIFVNHKRKQFQKNGLPQIKYPLTLVKRKPDEYSSKTQTNNGQMQMNFKPLSNILISKRICPSWNPQSPVVKKPLQKYSSYPSKHHSIKRIILTQQPKKQSITNDVILPMYQQIPQQSIKRNLTSLSYRIRVKQREKVFMENLSGMGQSQCLKKQTQDKYTHTFYAPSANNNQELIRHILMSRGIWKEVKHGDGVVPNFKWIFSKQKYNYKKMFSYTQFNEQVSTKDNLIRNLQIYCQTKKMQLFNITPVTFILDFDDEWCQYNVKQFLSFFSRHDPRKVQNKKQNPSTNSSTFLNKFKPYMAWQNSDIKKKVNILSRPVNNPCYYSQDGYLWLLKPTGLNRGRGIEIFDSLQTLQKMLMSFLQNMNRKKFNQSNKQPQKKKQKKDRSNTIKQSNIINLQNKDQHLTTITQTNDKSLTNAIQNKDKDLISPIQNKEKAKDIQNSQNNGMTQSSIVKQKFKLNNCSFVIQKYVQKPFLIQNRKFDIRVWALVSQNMQLFFFRQGYIRTSTQSYTTCNISNYFIHLTNNAIQKNSVSYGQFQSANQLSFKQLSQYMSQQQVIQIWDKIKEITYMTFSSVKKKINCNRRTNCFEIFGLDYFISSDKRVWLIEVNQNPCIQTSSGLLTQLVPRMLNDAFKLTVDQMMNNKIPQDKPYPVDGYPDSQNLWESLGQLIPNAQYLPKKTSKPLQSK